MISESQLSEKTVNAIRCLSIDAVEKANSGHPGLPMGAAAFAYLLFQQKLLFHPRDPQWLNRDRFVLSAGHGSMLLYSLLHLYGYDVSLDDLKAFRQYGSKTPGHPEFGHTPGVEATTGPLGQGTANAVGMALASKRLESLFADESYAPGKHRVFALVSDGDLMEGISYEAASLAGHLNLNNLFFLYDDNNISIDGSTDQTFTEDINKRFEAQGWQVYQADGHDLRDINHTLTTAIETAQKPTLIRFKTRIGFGSPKKEGKASSHGSPLGAQEVLDSKKALGWDVDLPAFSVPEDVQAHIQTRLTELESLYQKDQAELAQWKQRNPEQAQTLSQFLTRDTDFDALKKVLSAQLKTTQGAKKATRVWSSEWMQMVSDACPFLVGGSADLAASCKTVVKDGGYVEAGSYGGRNLHFGIREHAMGALANGMAYHGTHIPFVSTFLVFSDYMRNSIRLAALSKIPSIFIFTHDSIFVGEDGPTHQPIEQVASLRLIPNLQVIRPATDMETAAAWLMALERKDGPTVLILSRQNVEPLRYSKEPTLDDISQGIYTVFENSEDPEIDLFATGSEVGLMQEVQNILNREQDISSRLISVPSFERARDVLSTEDQDYLYFDRPKFALEAGHPAIWHELLGSTSYCLGMTDFGASASEAQLRENLGFNAESIAEIIVDALEGE